MARSMKLPRRQPGTSLRRPSNAMPGLSSAIESAPRVPRARKAKMPRVPSVQNAGTGRGFSGMDSGTPSVTPQVTPTAPSPLLKPGGY